MAEDIEEIAGTPAPATAVEDSSYSAILAGEGDAAKSATPEDKPSEEAPILQKEEPPKPDATAKFDPDEEVVLEIGGRTFTMKQGDVMSLLEKSQAIVDRENKIAEKEKFLNKDYTQKSQANAEFKKSVESVFGRFPEKDELSALGKIWKSYFENPQARTLIDAVLTGDLSSVANNGKPPATSTESEYIGRLEQKIQGLEARLESRIGEFTQSIEDRERAKINADSQKIFEAWSAKKAEAGIKITEEMDAEMGPFVAAIHQRHPDWEPHRILDEAFRHANIDKLKADVRDQVLVSADQAKKKGIIKITPKSSSKSDSEMSYAEIVKESI